MGACRSESEFEEGAEGEVVGGIEAVAGVGEGVDAVDGDGVGDEDVVDFAAAVGGWELPGAIGVVGVGRAVVAVAGAGGGVAEDGGGLGDDLRVGVDVEVAGEDDGEVGGEGPDGVEDDSDAVELRGLAAVVEVGVEVDEGLSGLEVGEASPGADAGAGGVPGA